MEGGSGVAEAAGTTEEVPAASLAATVWRALGASFDHHRRAILLSFTTAFAVVVTAAVLGHFRFGYSLYFFVDLNIARRPLEGALTAVSGFCFGAAGFLLLLVARQSRVPADRGRWWAASGLGALYLAMDEVLRFHEIIAYELEHRAGVEKVLGVLDLDVYVTGAYILVGLILATRMLSQVLRYPLALFPLAVALLLFIASQGVDLLPWHSMTEGQRTVFGPLEEGLKTLGSLSLLGYAWLVLDEVLATRERDAPRSAP
jgi:hypothetical protein